MASTGHRQDRRESQTILSGLITLVVFSASCVVSPIPQPPPLAFDGGGATVDYCENCDQEGIVITGAAGSVSRDGVAAADALVWGVDLGTTDPPAIGEVASDGSFSLQFVAFAGHAVRLQARQGESRSAPVDLVAPDEDGALTPLPHPFASCLRTSPELELSLHGAASGEVVLRNDCDFEVSINAPRIRGEGSAFSVESAIEGLAPGAEETVTIRFAGADPDAEEVLLVEVSEPERDLRAITVFAGPAD